MTTNVLSAGRVRELFDYSETTGVFTSRRKTSHKQVGERVGARRPDGYLAIYIDGPTYLAHRLAFLYVNGTWPAHAVDHKNGIRSDNRWENLREAPGAINAQNTHFLKPGTKVCLQVGAERRGSRFRARIKVNGSLLTIGTFATESEAHAAYMTAKRLHHAGCTV